MIAFPRTVLVEFTMPRVVYRDLEVPVLSVLFWYLGFPRTPRLICFLNPWGNQNPTCS